MSVYAGIDGHRKRSQVAVVTEDGTVELNKNVVNGSEPMLRLIGGLPPGTPVAFEAAFGWGWLVELLEDYGFDVHLVHPLRCKAIAPARLKTRSTPPSWRSCCARTCCPEAWIAPAKVHQLRALIRHRISLVRLGTQLRNRIARVSRRARDNDRSATPPWLIDTCAAVAMRESWQPSAHSAAVTASHLRRNRDQQEHPPDRRRRHTVGAASRSGRLGGTRLWMGADGPRQRPRLPGGSAGEAEADGQAASARHHPRQ